MGEDREEGSRGLIAPGSATRAPAAPGTRLLLWTPVVAMMGVQFFLSSQSRVPDLLPGLPVSDKLQHGAWFFLLGLFATRALREGEGATRRGAALAVLLGAVAWGVSDELHQLFVPGRLAEAADLAADVAGAGLAVLVAERLLRPLGLLSRRP